jgi:aromatic ring-opening dioxygenase catalytic subunit (LigB family)
MMYMISVRLLPILLLPFQVLIVGSGSGFHNMGLFGSDEGRRASCEFSDWLDATVSLKDYKDRRAALLRWRDAPSATKAHPRGAAEHFTPALVVAGAGRDATQPVKVLTLERCVGPQFVKGFKFPQFQFDD